MKCKEKGGCPLALDKPGGTVWGPCNRKRDDCHLTPADFDIIRAMIAGEWRCGKCIHFDCASWVNYADLFCNVLKRIVNPATFGCANWRHREDKPCPRCGGSGTLVTYYNEYNCEIAFADCPTCNGTGRKGE